MKFSHVLLFGFTFLFLKICPWMLKEKERILFTEKSVFPIWYEKKITRLFKSCLQKIRYKIFYVYLSAWFNENMIHVFKVNFKDISVQKEHGGKYMLFQKIKRFFEAELCEMQAYLCRWAKNIKVYQLNIIMTFGLHLHIFFFSCKTGREIFDIQKYLSKCLKNLSYLPVESQLLLKVENMKVLFVILDSFLTNPMLEIFNILRN